ncbi:phage head morphogenesis protein, partial [uncultured Cardiobacterium sp.]|uniref:phage head morphogenesis protein n=1 Tax=uncultured Cardiobacterium sp. TaxID=417619 RepID=UPI0026029A55
DHIQRIKDSLEKAIAEGTSFDNWRKENLADLQGLPKSYQETVFRTAVQSSYNAGRWAHFRDHAERRPILRYTAINDRRTRPAHRALHGLMMPVDDPRWQTLAPPGGFNCRCTLMSLSERQAKGMGYTGAPQDIPTWTDKHGVEHTAAPDKGWNHSPEHDLTDLLREREQRLNMNAAVYDSGDAPPNPEPWHPPLPGNDPVDKVRYDIITRGQQDGNEHAALLDKDGNVLAMVQGNEKKTIIADALEKAASVSQVLHNHPSGLSLSENDLYVAAFHRISVTAYATWSEGEFTATPLATFAQFDDAFMAARRKINLFLWGLYKAGRISAEEADILLPHLRNFLLHKQGVIDYNVTQLPPQLAEALKKIDLNELEK